MGPQEGRFVRESRRQIGIKLKKLSGKTNIVKFCQVFAVACIVDASCVHVVLVALVVLVVFAVIDGAACW